MKIIKMTEKQLGLQEKTSNFPVWFARQITRDTDNWSKTLELSPNQIQVIMEWGSITNPDIMGVKEMSLSELNQQAASWKRKQRANDYKTNDVVYEFDDGWKVVKISSFEDVETEALLMQSDDNDDAYDFITDQFEDLSFCTDESLKSGFFEIFSLRNPDNVPYATITISPSETKSTVENILCRERGEIQEKYLTEFFHPESDKIKQFLNYMKETGRKFYGVENNDSTIEISDLKNEDVEIENEFGIPYNLGFGGSAEEYSEHIQKAENEGWGGSYFYASTPKNIFDKLIEYAKLHGELNLLLQGVEMYEESLHERFFEWEGQVELEHPEPDDYPSQEDYMIEPDTTLAQPEFGTEYEGKPVPDKEAYEQAVKEYDEAMKAHQKEQDDLAESFEPYEFGNYAYREIQEAINQQPQTERPQTERPQTERPQTEQKKANVNFKMYKTADIVTKTDEIPRPEILETYVESLKMYLKDCPDIKEKYAELIKQLPSPRKIDKDYSMEECKLLYETIGYLWKKITGKDIIEESKITYAPESLLGNYLLIKPGILLHGINIYGIIKDNSSLVCSLLNINQLALQEYLTTSPNKLIAFVIKNGGIRLFINKNKKFYAQMSPKTYGEWGKHKIKKYDFPTRVIKIIDFKIPYKGWKSGIGVTV